MIAGPQPDVDGAVHVYGMGLELVAKGGQAVAGFLTYEFEVARLIGELHYIGEIETHFRNEPCFCWGDLFPSMARRLAVYV